MNQQRSREEFEVTYAASIAETSRMPCSAEEIRAMRNGDRYQDGADWLNGCWRGWQLAQGAKGVQEEISADSTTNMCAQPSSAKESVASVTVAAEPLRQVLQALIGPGHLIRELQATRSLHALTNDNPIEILIQQFNASVNGVKKS